MNAACNLDELHSAYATLQRGADPALCLGKGERWGSKCFRKLPSAKKKKERGKFREVASTKGASAKFWILLDREGGGRLVPNEAFSFNGPLVVKRSNKPNNKIGTVLE